MNENLCIQGTKIEHSLFGCSGFWWTMENTVHIFFFTITQMLVKFPKRLKPYLIIYCTSRCLCFWTSFYLVFAISFWDFCRATQVLSHRNKQVKEELSGLIWQHLQVSNTSSPGICKKEPGTEIFLKSVHIKGLCSLLNLGSRCIWRKRSDERKIYKAFAGIITIVYLCSWK